MSKVAGSSYTARKSTTLKARPSLVSFKRNPTWRDPGWSLTAPQASRWKRAGKQIPALVKLRGKRAHFCAGPVVTCRVPWQACPAWKHPKISDILRRRIALVSCFRVCASQVRSSWPQFLHCTLSVLCFLPLMYWSLASSVLQRPACAASTRCQSNYLWGMPQVTS